MAEVGRGRAGRRRRFGLNRRRFLHEEEELIEGEQGASIHVVLIDANTDHAITSEPESSTKLDFVVLEGDFNNADDEDSTGEESENHVVKEREGKRPLLTDNSSWIRSRKFRLGLKISSGYCDAIRIREGKTEAFTIKDHRGEYSWKWHVKQDVGYSHRACKDLSQPLNVGQSRGRVAQDQGRHVMGIFIRKKAAERRAQIIELEDE
ncbi:hypothetical protein KSP39_PZI002533 [Platanthera zijinensis]|uniref:Calmodulin binding protein-like N-terminal domain-containing protein n=1 Tax=Platanthera zijinensis TaxID=2320716 RepID=A0AAP0GEI6_9ASPA